MGYQESYVRMENKKDFNKLIETFKEVGKQYYEDNDAMPVEIITLLKPIQGTLAEMCEPRIKYKFEAGERFIYVTGERYIQRSVDRLFNNKNIKNVQIYYTECFPSEDIFENNEEKKMALHEEFIW